MNIVLIVGQPNLEWSMSMIVKRVCSVNDTSMFYISTYDNASKAHEYICRLPFSLTTGKIILNSISGEDVKPILEHMSRRECVYDVYLEIPIENISEEIDTYYNILNTSSIDTMFVHTTIKTGMFDGIEHLPITVMYVDDVTDVLTIDRMKEMWEDIISKPYATEARR